MPCGLRKASTVSFDKTLNGRLSLMKIWRKRVGYYVSKNISQRSRKEKDDVIRCYTCDLLSSAEYWEMRFQSVHGSKMFTRLRAGSMKANFSCPWMAAENISKARSICKMRQNKYRKEQERQKCERKRETSEDKK